MTTSPDGPPARRPATLLAAATLVALQALGLAVAAAFYLVEVVVASADDVVRALVTAALAALAAAGLAVVVRALLRARPWARSPALVTNLILLPVAWGLLQGGRWYVGVPLGAMAVLVVVLLFTPATGAALED